MSLLLFDLKRLIKKPSTYLFLSISSVFISAIFFNLYFNFLYLFESGQQFDSPVTTITVSFFHNINLLTLLLCSLMTHQVFSGEKETFYHLLKLRGVSSWKYLLSRYITIVVFGLLLLVPILVILYFLQTIGIRDSRYLLIGLLGLIFQTCFYSALCLMFFVFFKSNISSILASLAFGILLNFLPVLAINLDNSLLFEVFNYLSPLGHFQTNIRGIFKTSDIVFYSSGIFFFLFLAVQKLEWEKVR